MDTVKELYRYGQSLWLDYIHRSLITGGELKRLVDEGIRGLTSNPTIFEKALGETTDYDELISAIVKAAPQTDTKIIYERLAIEDIQMVADVLRSVYDASDGTDGFVSLEVSPHLAHDTGGTTAEARRLWRTVARPNLMIKVPATGEGIPAIETLIAEGINVNVTLMFSLAHYDAVAYAYIRGVERHPDLRQVASVASFFVSRVDTYVDRELEKIGTKEALDLRGKAAIANSKLVYRRFREVFFGEEFAIQSQRGARVQRTLWGSTSTKNPAYSDVMYVEGLIGSDTVNTVPLATLNAFRDHGRVRPTLHEELGEADRYLTNLAELGIDLSAIAEQLQVDGVAAFATSFDKLLATIDQKRQTILAKQRA